MVKTDLYRASFLVGAASRPFGPPALCSGPLNAGVAWIERLIWLSLNKCDRHPIDVCPCGWSALLLGKSGSGAFGPLCKDSSRTPPAHKDLLDLASVQYASGVRAGMGYRGETRKEPWPAKGCPEGQACLAYEYH